MSEQPPSPPQQNNAIRLGVFNIANSKIDEDSEYRLGNRLEDIQEKIPELGIHVLCVSELRTCYDEKKEEKTPPAAILRDLAWPNGFDISALDPVNLDELSFWRGALHNTIHVQHLQTFCVRHFIPSTNRIMISFHQYKQVYSDHTFWVIHNHMPMPIAQKLDVIRWLNDRAVMECWKREGERVLNCIPIDPIVFYGGDQNTFFDIPEDGPKMMELFKEGGWIDLTSDIKQTFRSFPNNPLQIQSKLDHWFVHVTSLSSIEIIKANAIDMEQLSDHFILTLDFRFVHIDENIPLDVDKDIDSIETKTKE